MAAEPTNVHKLNITIVTTGGTIAKTFNEADGSLHNDHPIVAKIVARLRLPDVQLAFEPILSKDSLELSEADRKLIVKTTREAAERSDAVIIAHGTDTLAQTGEMLCRELQDVGVPILLTGAMRPYEFRDSDAAQNLTEALLAARFLSPGVYTVMHNRVLRFPGVVKDRERLTFTKAAR